MAWRAIAEVPSDGGAYLTGRRRRIFGALVVPYPLISRLIAGRWCAQFGGDDWRSYDPQPEVWWDGDDPPMPSIYTLPSSVFAAGLFDVRSST